MAGSGTTINSVTFNPLKTIFTVNNNEYENAGSITISCSGSPDPSVYVSSIKSSDASIAEVILDDLSRAVSGSNVTTDFKVKPNSAGTVTLTATAFDNAKLREVTGTLEITVTAGAVDDESYLNKSGLIHFWDNIDNVKQDKLKAGTNITISADNTISADLETELSQYVTAEAIASTSALTPPVQTNMIADGAVSNAKIDWSSTSRPIYYRGKDWATSWTFSYDVYHPQLIFVAWEYSTAMFARIFDKIYKVFQDGGRTVTSSINTTNHTWTLSTDNTGVINVLELRNTKTGE